MSARARTGSRTGELDQLWRRPRDVARAKAFYERVAPVVGIRLVREGPGRVRFCAVNAKLVYLG